MIIPRSERIGKVETYYFARKLAEIAAMNQEGGPAVINLGIGSPDLLPPVSSINKVKEAIDTVDVHKYQSYRGIPELRAAYCGWYQREFDVSLNAENEILPLIGSKEGIMHISMAFLNPGDEALVPDPGYPAYAAVTKLCQGKVRKFYLKEEDDWLPDLKALEQEDLSKVKIMWLNYPHMPTGAKASKQKFVELVAFAKRHRILLCHDNPYSFILNDQPLSLLSIPGAKDVSLELTSLSKNYNMAGWRVGAVAGKKEYLEAVLTFKSNMDSGMFRPLQEAAIVALQEGNEWKTYLNETYVKRKKLAHQIMDLIGCSYDTKSVGMFVWGKIPNVFNRAEELADQFLYDARVFITPGHIFGKGGEKYLRISLCSSEVIFAEAIHRIKKCLNPVAL